MAGKKTVIDNIQFDSELESKHYEFFRDNKITITKFQPQFILRNSFKYFNIKTNRQASFSKMVYTPDFQLDIPELDLPLIVEVKGFQRLDYMMRKKLFIEKYNKDYYFIQLNNMKECKEFFKKYLK